MHLSMEECWDNSTAPQTYADPARCCKSEGGEGCRLGFLFTGKKSASSSPGSGSTLMALSPLELGALIVNVQDPGAEQVKQGTILLRQVGLAESVGHHPLMWRPPD